MASLRNLTEEEIYEAFANSGYSEVEFTMHAFIEMMKGDKEQAVYAVGFYNEDSERDDSGYIFIERKADGLLYGEF